MSKTTHSAKWVAATLPLGWTYRRLKHLATCMDGRRVPLNSTERSQVPGEYPYWGANGVVDSIGNYIFDEPLVLLGEDGAPFFDKVKPVAFCVDGKVWVNNHIHVLRPRPGVSHGFLRHWLNTVDYAEFVDGSTRDKLTQGKMVDIPIGVPPLATQKTIADFLDRKTAAIDALIEKKQRLLDLLTEKRAALINQAVTKGLDPNVPLKDSGVPWIGEIPAHWEVKRLKFEHTFTKGRNAQELTASYVGANHGPFPVYSGQTENDGVMGTIDTFAYEADAAILVTTVGSSKVMTPRYISGRFSLSQNCLFVGPRRGRTSVRYVYYQLPCLFAYERGSIPEHLQASLRVEDMRRFDICYPPLDEQRQIAAFLDQQTVVVDRLACDLADSADRLKEYRQALITAAVTGQLDIPETVVP